MTLKQIDDALAAWDNRLAAIAQNLLELQAESTYQLLTGSGGMAKLRLSGDTAAKVEPALGAMLTMFQQYDLLKSTIDRAAKLRKDLPAIFGTDQKLREIAQLLFQRSIKLPAVDVPLEQRTLLSGVQSFECIAAEELLQVMVRAFAAARDAVLAVDDAWRRLAVDLDRTEAQLARLNTQAATLAGATRNVGQILTEVRARVQNDPFGALSELDARVRPLLAQADKLAAAGERLRQELNQAHAQLDDLVGAHRETLAAAEQVRSKIDGCAGLPAPLADAEIAGLREWLDRLNRTFSEGRLEAAAVGLRNWRKAAQDCAAREKSVWTANRAPVEERDELRGRLQAMKAKARAYGVAEQDTMSELARQAEELLYTRPTNLKNAAAAVVAYEKTLNNGNKPGRRDPQ
jgi:chromosome segregation ATPase